MTDHRRWVCFRSHCTPDAPCNELTCGWEMVPPGAAAMIDLARRAHQHAAPEVLSEPTPTGEWVCKMDPSMPCNGAGSEAEDFCTTEYGCGYVTPTPTAEADEREAAFGAEVMADGPFMPDDDAGPSLTIDEFRAKYLPGDATIFTDAARWLAGASQGLIQNASLFPSADKLADLERIAVVVKRLRELASAPTPSPVDRAPDSERPDTARMREVAADRHASFCSSWMIQAADWIDFHRCGGATDDTALRDALAAYDAEGDENWLAHSQYDPTRTALVAAIRSHLAAARRSTDTGDDE